MSVFTEGEQKELNQQKVELKIENEKYLRKHPEVKIILSKLMDRILEEKPSHENILPTVEAFFLNNDLPTMVTQHKKEEAEHRKKMLTK
mmetsp:Transcript_23615/g.42575  ORF Transcript_23615/g.42575 Transcript_23615/m.42575 type:complete len:89 (+) Transcript_23615:89-355(+)